MSELLQSFVQLPEPLVATVTALIVSGVVLAVQLLVARVPLLKFLANYAEEWGYMLAAGLLAWFQNAVPDAYAEVAVYGLYLVLAIIAVATAARKALAARGVRGFAK